MKRYVVGTLLFSIVMFVQLFGNIPVFADTFVPTSSYDFTALADLGYALVGGAEFDFEGSPYVIDDYNSLSSEQKEIAKSLAAREFLKDYMESRGIAFEENGELQKGSAYYTIAFGLAGQEFFEAFQTASAQEQEDLEYNMPISPSRFADWAQYNKYWFKRYADSFESSSDVVVNVPQIYIQYLNIINGHVNNISNNLYDFFWYSYDNSEAIKTVSFEGAANNYSWFLNNSYTVRLSNWGTTNSVIAYPSGGNAQTLTVVASPIYNVYISSSNGTYSFNIDNLQSVNLFQGNWSYQSGKRYSNTGLFTYDFSNQRINVTFADVNSSSNLSFSGTLEDCFKMLSMYCRNVNIYVDGEPWSLVGNPAPANPTIPDFPDIINQETGELAYDIAMPKTQDYSGSFDLTSLFDAIREGIAGASDGDLATGSTIGSLDVGRTFTGEGIDIQDRVIDLTSSRVFDGTLTDDTTGRLPKPPVIPPAVSAGLGGVTVLAKYVDATQCILPEELITAFWGCVWILIMLGLIKNLHR